MLKRHCKQRAEWRLQLGKPAERLSAHYRLDCDYGTPIVLCWEEGGSEPINLCEDHTKELVRPSEDSPGVRAITSQSSDRNDLSRSSNNSSGSGERVESREAVGTKPNNAASLEAAGSSAQTHPKIGRAKKDLYVRSAARDLTYGDSAKALVDETIWNMEPGDYEAYRTALLEGKPVTEAAQAAGGQFAVAHRKISDYTLKLEAVLSESKVIINVGEAIDKPLEQALLGIMSRDGLGEQERDAAIQQLGALEAWVKNGLNRDISPLEANRIVLAIGDRLNWGGRSGVVEELKPAYRALFSNLKSAIRNAVPEAQNLHERLTNLYAAKSELENSPTAKELNPLTV